MEKFASVVASSRGFPLPFSRWAALLLVAATAIFVVAGTWYTRGDTSFDAYRNAYLNPQPSVEEAIAHTEVKELLVDHSHDPPPPIDVTSGNYTWDDCLRLPGADKILVILKTGATAIYDRLPIHLESTLKCIPNYMIISDLEQTIGTTKIHDVLKLVTQPTRETHHDFDLYHNISYYHATGQDASKLDSGAAWSLDKWKFLPMIHKAWDVAQTDYNNTIDWFVMMEADTSLSWLNLIQYLAPLDPKKPQYIGSPAMLVADQSSFAHGGSGVIMSRTALEKVQKARKTFSEGHEGSEAMSIQAYDKKWEQHTEKVCCGDAVLAHAFTAVGIPVTNARPMIQGDTPLSLPFEPVKTMEISPGKHVKVSDDSLWCKTPITFHHVNGEQVDELYRFEQSWAERYGWNTSYYYRDIFTTFLEPHVTSGQERGDWDNQSDWIKVELDDKDGVTISGPEIKLAKTEEQDALDEVTADSVDEPKKCRIACEKRGEPYSWKDAECVQWKWSTGKCYMDFKIRFGEAISQETVTKNNATWTSGWVRERIWKYKDGQADCESLYGKPKLWDRTKKEIER
ncbi:hypothetical protein Slin15195_G095920 [Septoria linicola]|uniref:N-acetylgalactosaminide beta-1,3-galactosyltransferase n=1 Tax=Septoria linicola TaxID=215465 RepID=A0A9Q9AZV2_9PEZI|nr:hypothetical protein Slin14017_G059010 [Septoria linicola]USW56273.1 hypothetical protein Slin15195_G095920 [Septoria linicola]